MNILENELVRKYFGSGRCESCFGQSCVVTGVPDHHACMSFRVLSAMQEPIREGERYLNLFLPTQWRELILRNGPGYVIDGWHSSCLRLPDRFQKKEIFKCVDPDCPCDKEHRSMSWAELPKPAPENCPTNCGPGCGCCKPADAMAEARRLWKLLDEEVAKLVRL
jgi:hypothetical protein